MDANALWQGDLPKRGALQHACTLSIIAHNGAATRRQSESATGLSLDAFLRGSGLSAGTPCNRRCCTFDNRGIGSSSIPEHFSAYKTGIMAADVRALMDHLGWARAHVMGMSLGW